MKFLGVLLAIFAVSCVRAGEEECTEERAEACIDNLLTAILDDTSEEEVCRELRSTTDCLKKAADDCLGDERDSEVEEGLEELEKLLRDNCGADDNDNDEGKEEIEKCFQENEDYMMGCIPEATEQALTLLLEKQETDENVMTCTMYGMMTYCFVERIREKCGEKAAKMAEEELDDIPVEIVDACNAMGDIDTNIIDGIHLIGDKKRK